MAILAQGSFCIRRLEDPCSINLSCDNASIPCDHLGNPMVALPTTYVSLYMGATPITQGVTWLTELDGMTVTSAPAMYTVTSLSKDLATLKITAMIEGKIVATATFTVSKVLSGADGKTPVIMELVPEHDSINRSGDLFTPAVSSCNAKLIVGGESEAIKKDNLTFNAPDITINSVPAITNHIISIGWIRGIPVGQEIVVSFDWEYLNMSQDKSGETTFTYQSVCTKATSSLNDRMIAPDATPNSVVRSGKLIAPCKINQFEGSIAGGTPVVENKDYDIAIRIDNCTIHTAGYLKISNVKIVKPILDYKGRNLILRTQNLSSYYMIGAGYQRTFQGNLCRIELDDSQVIYRWAHIASDDCKLNMRVGQTYTFSVSVKANRNIKGVICFRSTHSGDISYLKEVVITTALNQFSNTFVYLGEQTMTPAIIVRNLNDASLSAGDYIDIEYYKVEHGQEATPYSPAPEDAVLMLNGVPYTIGSPYTLKPADTELKWSLKWDNKTDNERVPIIKDGRDGKDGEYRVQQYKVSATKPTGAGTVTPPSVPSGQYLWMRTGSVIPPATEPASWSEYVQISGEKGQTGADGQKQPYYSYQFGYSTALTTTSATTAPTPAPVWSDTPPNAVDGQYLWQRVAYYSVNFNVWFQNAPRYSRLSGVDASADLSEALQVGNLIRNGACYEGLKYWDGTSWDYESVIQAPISILNGMFVSGWLLNTDKYLNLYKTGIYVLSFKAVSFEYNYHLEIYLEDPTIGQTKIGSVFLIERESQMVSIEFMVNKSRINNLILFHTQKKGFLGITDIRLNYKKDIGFTPHKDDAPRSTIYLTESLKESTSLSGGLINSSLMILGSDGTERAGIDGTSSKVGMFLGGSYQDAVSDAEKGMEVAKCNVSTMLRKDGAGHFANGKFRWDERGRLIIGSSRVTDRGFEIGNGVVFSDNSVDDFNSFGTDFSLGEWQLVGKSTKGSPDSQSQYRDIVIKRGTYNVNFSAYIDNVLRVDKRYMMIRPTPPAVTGAKASIRNQILFQLISGSILNFSTIFKGLDETINIDADLEGEDIRKVTMPPIGYLPSRDVRYSTGELSRNVRFEIVDQVITVEDDAIIRITASYDTLSFTSDNEVYIYDNPDYPYIFPEIFNEYRMTGVSGISSGAFSAVCVDGMVISDKRGSIFKVKNLGGVLNITTKGLPTSGDDLLPGEVYNHGGSLVVKEEMPAASILCGYMVSDNGGILKRYGVKTLSVGNASKNGTGRYIVPHNIGHSEYIVNINPQWDTTAIASVVNTGANSVEIAIVNYSGIAINANFHITLIG